MTEKQIAWKAAYRWQRQHWGEAFVVPCDFDICEALQAVTTEIKIVPCRGKINGRTPTMALRVFRKRPL